MLAWMEPYHKQPDLIELPAHDRLSALPTMALLPDYLLNSRFISSLICSISHGVN